MNLIKTISFGALVILTGCTSLPEKAAQGDVAGVQADIDSGVDLEMTAQQNSTALYEAAQAGNIGVVRALLAANANPNGMDMDDNWSALIAASRNGHEAVVHALLDRGANPNWVTNKGWTALHHAAYEGHTGIARALLKAGAEVDAEMGNGWTPLMVAVKKNNREGLVKLLLDNGAKKDHQNDQGWTAAMVAARNNNHLALGALIDRRASIKNKSLDGWTPLMLTVASASLEGFNAAELLLKKRSPIDTKNSTGDTALSLAARHNHFRTAELLLKNGADPSNKNFAGMTALDQARDKVRFQRLVQETRINKLIAKQRCRTKHTGWIYTGRACSGSYANGNGSAVEGASGNTFTGQIRNGNFVAGKIMAGNSLVFEGNFRNGLAHGDGTCSYQNSLEQCRMHDGKRIDSLHKQRVEFAKQQETLRKQQEEIARLRQQQQQQQAEQKDLGDYATECAAYIAGKRACDELGMFGGMACMAVLKSQYPSDIGGICAKAADYLQ